MAKVLPCDHCEQEEPAKFLLQDVTTGESVTFCNEHYAMHAMNVAEAYVKSLNEDDDSKSDEQREVYDDPGPTPTIQQPQADASNGRGNDSVPVRQKDSGSKSETETTG